MEMELSPGPRKLELAQEVLHIAHQNAKAVPHISLLDAELEFAKQSLNNFPEQFEDLFPALEILLKLRKKAEHKESAMECLRFGTLTDWGCIVPVWWFEARRSRLRTAIPVRERLALLEGVADKACDLKLLNLGLAFYKDMLK